MRVPLRKATAADIPAIVQASLTSASKEDLEGFTAPEWVTYTSVDELRKVWMKDNRLQDESEVIVAEVRGRVVGFIGFKREHDYFYVDNIDVTKGEQRKGIGKALVAHVEQVALTEGFEIIKTDTTENVKGVPWSSYGFWTHIGYEDRGERLPTKWSFKTIPLVKRLR